MRKGRRNVSSKRKELWVLVVRCKWASVSFDWQLCDGLWSESLLMPSSHSLKLTLHWQPSIALFVNIQSAWFSEVRTEPSENCNHLDPLFSPHSFISLSQSLFAIHKLFNHLQHAEIGNTSSTSVDLNKRVKIKSSKKST